MSKKATCRIVYDRLFSIYGECVCPLRHETPFQLLAAVMLSAQCRDERVNEVTATLFKLFPDAASMAGAAPEAVEEIVRPCGLFRAKSANMTAAARMIVARFGGRVPECMEELLLLPGIGRKSANVLLGNAFGKPGLPVDTHVTRLSNRLGLVSSENPEVIERELCPEIEPEKWCNFSHLLINHGRKVCFARRPACGECRLAEYCPSRREA